MKCPVCGQADKVGHLKSFTYFSQAYEVKSCTRCDIWFYDPFPTPDYKNDLSNEFSLRHYLETFAGIESITGISENFFSNYAGESKNGLEIGAGFGFASHYLRSLHHVEMTSYEPSDYGTKGKELLGIPIISDYFRREEGKHYDFCITMEVLEHIEKPVDFLMEIQQSLNNRGKVLLTTPNKNAVDFTRMYPVDLSLLSPGMHTILFSDASLKQILLRAGFSHVQVKLRDTTLYAIASNEPFSDKELFSLDQYKLSKYYEVIFKNSIVNSSLYKGIFYRLFRLKVDLGFYKEAVSLLHNNPSFYVLSEDEIEKIEKESDFSAFYSLSDSIIYYYCGILYLNFSRKYEKAIQLFRLSFLSCKKRLEIIPQFSIVDADIIWNAKLHEGIANEFSDRLDSALQCYTEILLHNKNLGHLPVPGEYALREARNRGKSLFEKL